MIRQTDSIIPPDRPSPIPAWRHYYICKYAEEKILRELEEQNPENLLAGLGIGYLFIPKGRPQGETGERFCMSHGYWVDCENVEVEDDQLENEPVTDDSTESEQDEEQAGLDEDFISGLYEEVRELVLQTAPEDSGEYLISLEITTAHFSTPKLKCQGRKCDFCAQHAKLHIFKKKRNKQETACVWSCIKRNCGG